MLFSIKAFLRLTEIRFVRLSHLSQVAVNSLNLNSSLNLSEGSSAQVSTEQDPWLFFYAWLIDAVQSNQCHYIGR